MCRFGDRDLGKDGCCTEICFQNAHHQNTPSYFSSPHTVSTVLLRSCRLSRRAVSNSSTHFPVSDVIHRCLSHSLMNAASAHSTLSVTSQREKPTCCPVNPPSFTLSTTTTTTTTPLPLMSIPHGPFTPPSPSLALPPRHPSGPLLPALIPLLLLLTLSSPEARPLPFRSHMENLSSLLLNPLPHHPPWWLPLRRSICTYAPVQNRPPQLSTQKMFISQKRTMLSPPSVFLIVQLAPLRSAAPPTETETRQKQRGRRHPPHASHFLPIPSSIT